MLLTYTVKHLKANITVDRPLTTQEQLLIRWLLEHGETNAIDFLPQLLQARVIGRCSCGCASIDLAITGNNVLRGAPMDILSDYLWRDEQGHLFGAYVFAHEGLLAGLDLWSVDGQAMGERLPEIHELWPMESKGSV